MVITRCELTVPHTIRRKLVLRVEALIHRKIEKGEHERSRRERSHSYASSACSQAPSEFFSRLDSQLRDGDDSGDMLDRSTSFADDTFLKPPRVAAGAPPRQRIVHSAEPSVPLALAARTYSHLLSNRSGNPSTILHSKADAVNYSPPAAMPRRAASLTDLMSELVSTTGASHKPSGPLHRSFSVSKRVGSLYPSLDELAEELRPKRHLPIRGGRVKAAVSQYEAIEEEHSLEVIKEQKLWQKRKTSELDANSSQESEESKKRIRI